jgi:hypothetical protein
MDTFQHFPCLVKLDGAAQAKMAGLFGASWHKDGRHNEMIEFLTITLAESYGSSLSRSKIQEAMPAAIQ